jgi:hypothetical protein
LFNNILNLEGKKGLEDLTKLGLAAEPVDVDIVAVGENFVWLGGWA